MAIGDFLGGVVRQRNISRELAIGEGQLGINQRLVGLKQTAAEQKTVNEARKALMDNFTTFAGVIGKLRSAGTPEAIAEADRIIGLSGFDEIAASLLASGDPAGQSMGAALQAQLDSLIQAAPTPQQQAAVAGESAAIQTTAEAQALVARGGEEVTVREAAGLAPAPTDVTVLEREREELIAAGDMEGALTRTNMIAKLAGVGQGNQALMEDDGGLKISATNSLRAEIAGIFGGIFDPVTGLVSGLSKEEGIRATAIAAQASQLLIDGEATNIPQAAAMAAAKFGIGTPQPVERKRQILADAVATFKALAKRAEADVLQQQLIDRLESQFAITEEEFRVALEQ